MVHCNITQNMCHSMPRTVQSDLSHFAAAPTSPSMFLFTQERFMADLNLFKFSIASRHPKFLNAYDAASHSYKAEYIAPTQWHLKLSFNIEDTLRRKKNELEALQNPRPQPEDERPGRHNRPPLDMDEIEQAMEALQSEIDGLIQTIQTHDFWFRVEKIGLTIRHADGSQSTTITSTQDSPVNALHPILTLTQQGRYRLTSFTKHKNEAVAMARSSSQLMTLKDILICTIGDSYACGEGNPDVPAEPTSAMRDHANMGAFRTLMAISDYSKTFTPELELAQWQEPLAHRSYKAGHTLGAELISGKYADMQVVTTHPSFARSGAAIVNGLIKPHFHYPPYYPQAKRKNQRVLGGLVGDNFNVIETGEFGFLDEVLRIGQIEEMEKTLGNRRPDFLLVTVGGNDCGWIPAFTGIIKYDSGVSADDVRESVGGFIDLYLEQQLMLLDERLSQMPQQPRHVLLTLYPKGFFGDGTLSHPTTNRNCGIFDAIDFNPLSDADSQIGIDDYEAAVIKALADRLNNKLREFVINQNNRNGHASSDPTSIRRQFKWHIVEGIDTDFEVHGYCSLNPLFDSAEHSYLAQGDWNGTMHPNRRGQEAYANRIANTIRAILNTHLEEFHPHEHQRIGDPLGGGMSDGQLNQPI